MRGSETFGKRDHQQNLCPISGQGCLRDSVSGQFLKAVYIECFFSDFANAHPSDCSQTPAELAAKKEKRAKPVRQGMPKEHTYHFVIAGLGRWGVT